MSGTTMVVMIVFICVGLGMVGEWVKRYLAFKEKALKHSGDSEQMHKELAALKSRVETLEKIVTDEGYQLDKKISNL
ncbi:hypothetical protein C1E23_19765 [Pseudoalteromonas phenolica]|uniref:Phage shock protein B n=1 Tax=Pseudoalteromonas phenolica TaxID=161398 RepID=A0A4Q7IJI0_9GAMM|nr:hypothetical protein [Pseudoalteromonas phenolica]RZQ51366.1 hypothetical protein C1E23_19765 [Pseudoalteromonas phenolica]